MEKILLFSNVILITLIVIITLSSIFFWLSDREIGKAELLFILTGWALYISGDFHMRIHYSLGEVGKSPTTFTEYGEGHYWAIVYCLVVIVYYIIAWLGKKIKT